MKLKGIGGYPQQSSERRRAGRSTVGTGREYGRGRADGIDRKISEPDNHNEVQTVSNTRTAETESKIEPRKRVTTGMGAVFSHVDENPKGW
jgi:hypothetical protein